MKKLILLLLFIPTIAYGQTWGGGSSFTKEFPFPVSTDNPRTAFGELLIAELTPVIQVQYPYNINSELTETRLNGGAAVIDTNRLKISTGASANQSAQSLTVGHIKYHPGQGALARFTSIFTAGVSGSTQIHGVITESDGFAFGYNGTDFGVLRRSGGSPKIVQMIVTTKASSAGNVTIQLDGNSTVIAVTNGADTTVTANEIAAGDYSGNGTGWRTLSDGSTVTFISYDAAVHSGTYTFTDTDITGAASTAGITNLVTGVAQTDTWVTQANWNHDVMDGTGSSGMNLDQTKGNVYQIRYQWLGFGEISYWIEDDGVQGGGFVRVHSIHYTNTSTATSVQNPTFPISMKVENTSNTSDIIMFCGSMAGFVEGKENDNGLRHGATATATTFSSGVETPVLTIRNKEVYQGQENRVDTLLSFAGLSQDSTKTALVKFTFNATLVGASFSDVSTNTSTVQQDTSATSISGGQVAFAQGIARTDKTVFDLGEDVDLRPGDTLTISIIPNAANPDVTAAINWIDNF